MKRLFILLLILSIPHFALGATLKELRYVADGDKARVYIDLSGDIEFNHFRLSSPERLCIDITNATTGEAKTLPINEGILRSIRAGQFNPKTLRVVLEFGAKPSQFDIKKRDGGLLIEFPSKITTITSSLKETPIVVLDPGHGGHDPGAIGPKGLMEKDVTLAIALKIKRILEKTRQYKVYLTRGKDEYLDLEKRAQIANKRGADIFVSIHANASPNRDGKGIESYILNWTDDEEAMKVAARENAITLRRMKEARSEVGLILASLELQAKRDDSLGLAHMIQGSLIKNVSDNYKDAINLGVKQALFYVLVGAKMPSVLVEISFISNPFEEKLLRKNEYRESISKGISEGIIKYFSTLNPVQDKPKREIALRF